MPLEKTPGCDGLTVIFYLYVWEHLENILFQAYNYAYERNQLHLLAQRVVITLIPKKQRDLYQVRNWHPFNHAKCRLQDFIQSPCMAT